MKNEKGMKGNAKLYVFSGLVIGAGLVFYFVQGMGTIIVDNKNIDRTIPVKEKVVEKKIERKIPDVVKAVYVTMHTAGNTEKMDKLIALANDTEVNAMVIDVKGSQGELVFDMIDISALLEKLHEADIHAIARVVVFQDSSAVARSPDTVILKKGGGVWRDRKGFAWVDPASEKGWKYIFDISKRALDIGFDEINFDYIRFPTDGNLEAMAYPAWDEKIPRYEIIKKFAMKAREVLKAYKPTMSLSLDIFGYTFIQKQDLGIGQRLEDMMQAFDYVYPMVYPSHYSKGNFGFTNPAEHPYEVVKGTLESGLNMMGENATSSAHQIRPWLQAFNMGAIYTPELMRAQIKGTTDGVAKFPPGSTGWLLWDPGNNYNNAREYLEK